MKQKIDFVVSWVNSNDTKWQTRKNDMLKEKSLSSLMVGENRYHDYGFFKYWFRSIEKYAPWVNHVFVVTDKQVPDFFRENKKVTIVDHEDFIPHEFLPTFSSSVIELYLDKIPGLQDNFVYFNDDMFLNASVEVSDFFSDDGLPKDMAVPTLLAPHSDFDQLPFNNAIVINKYFKKHKILKERWRKFFKLRYGFVNLTKLFLTLPFPYWSSFSIQHIPYSLRKSDYNLLRSYAHNEIIKTSKMHFRSDNDINLWLLGEIRFMLGEFTPRAAKEGIFFDFDTSNKLIECLQKEDTKMICINDDSKVMDLDKKIQVASKILEELEKKFPYKSIVEK